MWKKIKQDLIERFGNWDTVKGLYGLIASIITLYVAIAYVNYVIIVCGALWAIYGIIHHLYEAFANPIKAKIKEEDLIFKRKIAMGAQHVVDTLKQ